MSSQPEWELMIRSGNIDLLRTTLGGVDRAFYRFTRQLKFNEFFHLVFAEFLHVGQFLNRARGLPRSSNEQNSLFILNPSVRQFSLGWNGGCYAALSNHRPHFLIQMTSPYVKFCLSVAGALLTRARPFWRLFSSVCCVLLVLPRSLFTLIAAVTSGLSALPPSF